METKFLSRSYLETLSSADLISLADDYGIDIPDDLNRRFIIGELLEVAEELKMDEEGSSAENEMIEADSSVTEENIELPKSYNESRISVVLRNPAWAFVYWDIKETDRHDILGSEKFKHLLLRVSYFESEEALMPVESFDIKIDNEDREQYVLLSTSMLSDKKNSSLKKFVRMDIVAVFSDKTTDNLAVSRKVELPEIPEMLSMALPGRDLDVPPILELSGIKELPKKTL
ncbi:DUF4912 domain-containing protein [Treponema zioleckii]|uniref:DUF4912 domain-containing protein n=1 Tax=Treponema zioleckii TaxID=331680 RepID=UPI00168B0EDF|nr:DUF4912 domain-containing protein [Treponema zioleckii]